MLLDDNKTDVKCLYVVMYYVRTVYCLFLHVLFKIF